MSSALASVEVARAKSPEAFRTISEVSVVLDVPQHVLRFWETRFVQVRPVKRAGGRRFYRPDDVALLRGIRSLLYSDGYTIKGVQKVLRDRGWRYVAELGRRVAEGDTADWTEGNDGAVPNYGDRSADPRAGRLGDDRERSAAAMAALLRAHADAVNDMTMAEHKRVKIELLLAELLVLRDRLRHARPAGERPAG